MQRLIIYAYFRYFKHERGLPFVAKLIAKAIPTISGGTANQPATWSPTPDQIDYVIGQLTGGVGREMVRLAQTIAAPFTGDELPAHKIPLLGRLYGGM
jgi:hypothetical protein